LTPHRWNTPFWLGFPIILGLFLIHRYLQGLVTEIPAHEAAMTSILFGITGAAAYGALIVWILLGVRSLSRSTPSNAPLTTFARIQVSLGFAALASLALTVAGLLGPAGYLAALGAWLTLFIFVRTIRKWISTSCCHVPARDGDR